MALKTSLNPKAVTRDRALSSIQKEYKRLPLPPSRGDPVRARPCASAYGRCVRSAPCSGGGWSGSRVDIPVGASRRTWLPGLGVG